MPGSSHLQDLVPRRTEGGSGGTRLDVICVVSEWPGTYTFVFPGDWQVAFAADLIGCLKILKETPIQAQPQSPLFFNNMASF